MVEDIPLASSRCPLCGVDTPHHHSAETVRAFQEMKEKIALLTNERDALRAAVVEMAIPYEALGMDDESRKWIAPSVWRMIVEATETARRVVDAATPARPTDTGSR